MAAAVEQPQTIRTEAAACALKIAGEVGVLPAERRDRDEQRIRRSLAAAAQGIKRPSAQVRSAIPRVRSGMLQRLTQRGVQVNK